MKRSKKLHKKCGGNISRQFRGGDKTTCNVTKLTDKEFIVDCGPVKPQTLVPLPLVPPPPAKKPVKTDALGEVSDTKQADLLKQLGEVLPKKKAEREARNKAEAATRLQAIARKKAAEREARKKAAEREARKKAAEREARKKAEAATKLQAIARRNASRKVKKGGKKRKTVKRKQVPWAGWSKQSPSSAQRSRMYRKCGSKCFLGKNSQKNTGRSPSFPICKKNTCKISKKGLYAGYVRARQWSSKKSHFKNEKNQKSRRKTYKRVANKAKRMLKKRGYHVGR